ncbi:TPA: transcriptional regulator [Pseudomonas aeruginosa]
MSRRLLFVATLVATLSLAAHADEPLPSVEQVMNEHKEKIRNQLETINYKRKRMVEANMALYGTEAETFWPIYSRYRGETDSLHKETFQLLLEYARAYGSGSITDAEASRMVDLYRGLQEKQLAVLHRYVQEVAEKMSPRRAMRFLQIEAQLDALEALQIGKQVPLIN